jgi:hypothetical protein
MLLGLRSLWEPGTPIAVTPSGASIGILAMPVFLVERRKERQLEEEFVTLMFDEL